MSIWKISLIVCTSFGLSGCSYVYSKSVSQGAIGKGSIVYALQDSIVDINLSDVTGGVNYRNISLASRTVADRNAQVAVRIQSNPVSKETLTINVDSQSSLLKSINSTVDGKLDEVIVEAARSIGRLRGAGFLSDNADTVADQTIASFRVGDRVEFAAAASEFRRRTGFGIICLEGCTDVSAQPPAAADAVIYYRTPAVLKLGFCKGDCQKGSYAFPMNMLTFRTIETFNSPNLVSFPVRGSAFGEVVDNITFSDGVPETVVFNGTSEALDIVKVPGAVVAAVFEGIASGTGDRASAINAESAFANAEAARANARKAAAEATIAEIEAFEKLHCTRNPEECKEETPSTGDSLPSGLGG
ncbi:hypothetical protein WNZ14_09340 [Hoeflea sp. AS60]|uniref:hypothetical protein n=1 Tax=Hoeflea sp. AS60 TaxID=3135780 RepID=UPI00317F4FAD